MLSIKLSYYDKCLKINEIKTRFDWAPKYGSLLKFHQYNIITILFVKQLAKVSILDFLVGDLLRNGFAKPTLRSFIQFQKMLPQTM